MSLAESLVSPKEREGKMFKRNKQGNWFERQHSVIQVLICLGAMIFCIPLLIAMVGRLLVMGFEEE
jgi:hypothetical protein